MIVRPFAFVLGDWMCSATRPWKAMCHLAAMGALLLAGLVAYGGAAAHETKHHLSTKRYTFDLISGITTDPFYITMYHGAHDAARALGVNLIGLGAPDAFSPATQIPYVDLAIARTLQLF
jgi:ABC-type sugar transport system substrate-binding protein